MSVSEAELLSLYDLEERIKASWPTMVREEAGPVVRHRPTNHSSHSDSGFIAYTLLDTDSADGVINEQIKYFRGLGLKIGWKLYDHDQPSDLSARLLMHGFVADEQESIMALDLAEAPDELLRPVELDIRRIEDLDMLEDLRAIEEAVWQEDQAGIVSYLREVLATQPEKLSVYLGYHGQQPVSAAWIFMEPGRPFASLWGGSTLEAYRKQGFYTALLAVRVQEARRCGAQFLTIDASPMSRPIAQRHGFRHITSACDYLWAPQRDGSSTD